jgi:beta-phosphoglucomutase-like phosphatase (HAD superfamily)
MNPAEKPYWDADSSVSSVLHRFPVFRIWKPFLSKFITPSRELGVGPEECLAIEDSPAGVKAALAAGAEIIAVTTDLTRQKFRDTDLLDRSHIVDDARTLPEVVRRLISAHGQPLGN